jgi:hypothetical protein
MKEHAMTLFLGIPPKSGIDWNHFPYFAIDHYLRGWLGSCCGQHTGIRIVTTDKRHVMTPQDGLVYLVGDRTDSVIARVGAAESPNFDIGQTSIKYGSDAGMISEVYVNPFGTSYAAAATVYHELLHNKFQIFFVDVHATAGGNFTTATAPYDLGGPSAADQDLMCRALSATATQCQAGFDLPG